MKRMTITLFITLVLVMMTLVPLPVSASTNGHTQTEAVAWANKQVGEKLDYDGYYGAQCVDLIYYYLAYLGNKSMIGGHAIDYMNKTLPSGWSSPSKPKPGDIVVWGKGVLMTNGSEERSDSNYGHIGIVLSVSGDTMTTVEQNTLGKQQGAKRTRTVSKVGRVIHPDWPAVPDVGKEMDSGYSRTIPDGDYLICTAGTTDKASFYFLDIQGSEVPATARSNVQLCGPLKAEPSAYDIWTLKYNSGFYTITQKSTNMALDVEGASKTSGANVQIYTSNDSSAQKWAISANGRNGYRIQAKCSSFSLDVKGGKTTTSGTNVQQYSNNDTDAQSWFFVPYQPAQPIENGRYVLLSGVDNSYELDIAGNTGNIENHTNVQIWKDTASSQNNAFTFTKLSNGYYKITQSAGNKALDVYGAASTINANITMYTDNDSAAQQWAVTREGTGYALRAKCSGMALDVHGGTAANGTNVQQYPYNSTKAQNWIIVPAEYIVSYNANSGSGAPAAQVKYYKSNLTLSTVEPVRSGYTFLGWAADPNATNASYQPGTIYSEDSNISLYAVWTLNSIPEPAPESDSNPFLFDDVQDASQFYFDPVYWAYYADPQITNGIDDTHFGPNQTVTRGQCVTFLWRAMGKPEPASDNNPFIDVKDTDYFHKAVLWAVEKGITDGVDDTHFAPAKTLSTAHITTFLYRTLGIGGNGWYMEAADWAAEENLLDNMDLIVDPGVNCPRGSVVTFLYRVLK